MMKDVGSTLEGERKEPLSLIWKAALRLEGRYRQEGRQTLPLLIARHGGLMVAHPEGREDLLTSSNC